MEEKQEEEEIDHNHDKRNFLNGEVNMIIGGSFVGAQLSSSILSPKARASKL